MTKWGISSSAAYASDAGPGFAAPSYDQARACVADRLEHERAPVLEGEHTRRLEAQDTQADRGMQQDRFADVAVLPLPVNPIRVAHPAAGQVFEPFVAVEAATILTDLRGQGQTASTGASIVTARVVMTRDSGTSSSPGSSSSSRPVSHPTTAATAAP